MEDSLHLPKRSRRKRRAKSPGAKAGVSELLESIRAALKEKDVEEALKKLAKLEKVLMA